MNLNWKLIILAIILIQAAAFVIGFGFGKTLTPDGVRALSVFVIVIPLIIVGCMSPTNRWLTIIVVAAGSWATNLVNVVIGWQSLSSWIISIVGMAIIAAIAGAVSLLITAFNKAAASA
jgi:hypothetical protein